MKQLHQSNIRVEFNPNVLRQVDEAKKKYIEARNANRQITDLDGKTISLFRPVLGGFVIKETSLAVGEFAMRIFDDTGDRRIIWNSLDPGQIREAKALFDSYVAKGWKPYAIDNHGKMGKRIRGFDLEAEEIVFEEAGIREKFKNFASKFKEVKMMPRSYPG